MSVPPVSAPDRTARLLSTLDGCRVVEIDRAPVADRPGADRERQLRLAGTAAAYHADVPLLLGWRRERANGPIEILAGGAIVAAHGSHAVLTVPAGARGQRLPAGALLDMFAAVCRWTRVAGVHDGLLSDVVGGREGELRPSLEDCLIRAWPAPFAWLVLAEPVPPAEAAAEAMSVSLLERDARTRSTPEHTVLADRLSRRYRELRRAESTGLWRVHLLAGGQSTAAAARVAALLVASADLTDLPYQLMPAGVDGDLVTVLAAAVGDRARPSPFLASSALVAALACGPADEIPGVRARSRSTFDVTPEPVHPSDVDGPAPVRLGYVLDRGRSPVEELQLSRDSLNRHTFVTGATGAGKSQTVRGLLEQCTAAGLPWLVVEPAKAEYRLMAARLGPGRVTVVRPGDPDAVPAGLNPLEPAPGFALQTHLDLVRALFVAAFDTEEPFPQIIAAALTRCYTDLGWDLVLGEPTVAATEPPYPTLSDLQRTAERVINEIGYSREITDNVLGFVRVRLASLRLGTTGRMFEGGHPIDFDMLMRRTVVFEIEDVGDDRDKAFLMGAVLIRLVEHLRVGQRRQPPPPPGLRHVTVFEEAHRLLRRADRPGAAAHAVELFAAMLAEIRAYGEGLVIAEQIPSKLVPDVIKNTAVKVVHRLPAADDRLAVGATMNLTEPQSRYLVSLSPGTAALFSDGMDQPLLVGMLDGTDVEATGSRVVAPTAAVVGRRSQTCGRDCRDSPCTLRDLRVAQRLGETERGLRAWCELSVLSHLTGWATPAPRPHVLAALAALPSRLRDCALSQAVDTAVRTRTSAVADRFGATALAVHVVDVLRTRFDGAWLCVDEEPHWLARPYRWALVHDALRDAYDIDPGVGRHPDSDRWQERYGRTIPGATLADQYRTVRGWFDADLRDLPVRQTVAFGDDRPSALELLVGVTRDASDWAERLGEVLDEFIQCTWPPLYLVRRRAPTDREGH